MRDAIEIVYLMILIGVIFHQGMMWEREKNVLKEKARSPETNEPLNTNNGKEK